MHLAPNLSEIPKSCLDRVPPHSPARFTPETLGFAPKIRRGAIALVSPSENIF
jgi:hypothetical protein